MCQSSQKQDSTIDNYPITDKSTQNNSKQSHHHHQHSPLSNFTYLQPQQPQILLIQPHLQPKIYLNRQGLIGSGSFSHVYQGFIVDDDEHHIPIVIKESKYTKEDWEERFITRYEAQVEGLWMLANCPYAIKMYCAFYSSDNRLCLVLQKCINPLDKYIDLLRSNPTLALQVFTQMIEYLAFAHNIPKPLSTDISYRGKFLTSLSSLQQQLSSLVHKDIKPANILVRSLSQESISIAVADLGMVQLSPNHQTIFKTRFGGTLRYQSPQMQMKHQYDSRTDCWSFGILARNLFVQTIRLQKMAYDYRIQAMKQMAQRLRIDFAEKQFRGKQLVILILKHCLVFKRQDRWHSHELKEIRDNLDFIQQALSRAEQTQYKIRQIFLDLVASQTVLLEERNRTSSNLQRKCLQKIVLMTKTLLGELVDYNSLIIPEVIASSQFIFGPEETEKFRKKWQKGQYLFTWIRKQSLSDSKFKDRQQIARLSDLMLRSLNPNSSLAKALLQIKSSISDLP